MMLLIDAGNSRIKWALAAPGAAPGAWLASGAVAHAGLAGLAQAWQQALAGRPLRGALVANVAGAALGAALEQALATALPPPALRWFASLPQLAGLRNGYRNPAQLGCDRFAAAIGARALAPGQALIVANCGTATTVDAITADGRFIGGMILPGLALMAGALARNTAQLPHIGHDAAPPPLFADNTDDAILSGCLAAQAGAIGRACAAHGAAACIVSGGAAPAIAAALPLPHRLVENIVLIGLQVAAGGEAPC
ncbi:type III pantothenate kinase [Janthinobacterium fluminis]|uniref:Type III pantothenate kinase n=1 Tax=Janthinobacterium fluminis TaxID=2987524 RepID=A0ABT5K959_9BURK|nr:type III pantothenate kinase [Janthinobacterium fluminis]MDC8760616.1 type III pantothenate kinase [Janthinobacterium fluminis]